MRRFLTPAVVVLVGVLGFLTRFGIMYRGGLDSPGSYDDGVYFAGAISLAQGLFPYRDFLLLHPPGVLLASLPFAWLAPWLGDAHAFVAARIFFMLIGGLNAALVALVLKRWGVGAMLAGGFAYAFSYPAIYGERSVLLEVFGSTGILLSLLALQRARGAFGRHRWWYLAGAFAGLTVIFKIWYAPLVVGLLLCAGVKGKRWAGMWRFLVGALVAPAVVLLPFAVAGLPQMFRDVVLAQLGRPGGGYNPVPRVDKILGTENFASSIGWQDHRSLIILAILLGAACAVGALRLRGARVFVVLAAVTGIILFASPSFFQHYAVLTAMPLALVVGAGVGWVTRWAGTRRNRQALASIMAAGVVLFAIGLNLPQLVTWNARHVPAGVFQAIAKVQGCVGSDDPTFMLLANRYSHDVSVQCNIEVDPSGYGYVLPTTGTGLQRPDNEAFQKHARVYIKRTDGFILTRNGGYGLDEQSKDVIRSFPILYRDGNVHLVLRGLPAAYNQ